MNTAGRLPFRASPSDYQREAEALLSAAKSGDGAAQWSFKWEHPRFRGKPVEDVKQARLDLADAQLVIARQYGFETWADLAEFAANIARGGPAERFETAVEAVIDGDLAGLRAILRANPELARARSTRRHHATLLHYLAANGVEGERQRTPANAVEVAQLLLEAGSEVDALADMYENQCTTMSMLVSSSPPAEAGLQIALAETLLDHGAALEGPGSRWQSALMTALAFGFLDTARMLARRGAGIDDVAAAAGLGRLDETARLLATADGESKHIALALAAQHGHADVVRALLDAGEDPNRYNPDGFHAHSTPLHQAVCSNHAEVVRTFVERGASLDMRDTLYHGTPLGWAIYCERPEVAAYLRSQGAPAE